MSQTMRLPSHRGKILAIDDRLDNLELLSAILTIEGYEVEKCDRSKLAVKQAKISSPDLILLDICMSEMDGFSVCEILKQDNYTKNIPIIFISALEETESKIKAFKFGGSDYITKPFQIEEVLIRIETQLKYHYLQAELKEKNKQLEEEIKNRKVVEAKLLEANQKLSKLAVLDGLTNIANRYHFDRVLTQEWRRGHREKFPLSLIFVDVDHFKLYNDRYGHQAGDKCLQKIAQATAKAVNRPADLAARYGGEEFAVILPQTTAENALQVAEKVRQQVEILNIPHSDSLTKNLVSVSLGVASVIPSYNHTKQELLVTADKALYQAKNEGRDRVIFKDI